jgi:hypothetical protein
MAMEPDTRTDCDGEGQQQFTRPAGRPTDGFVTTVINFLVE